MVIITFGLVALFYALDVRSGVALWLNRFALLSAAAAMALYGVLQAVDGVGLKQAVNETIDLLDQGRLRVAEKTGGKWITHQWIKKAVLLSFRLQDNFVIRNGDTQYYDKVPSKFADYSLDAFQSGGFRVVPEGQGSRPPLDYRAMDVTPAREPQE